MKRSKDSPFRIILILILLVLVSYCSSNEEAISIYKIQRATSEGTIHQLHKERGFVLVLDFWATWCDPCAKAVPVVNKMKQLADIQKFHFWGVNTDTEAELEEIQNKSKEWRMESPSLLDSDWKLVDLYKIQGQPALVVLGRDGNEIYRQLGLDSRDLPGLLLRMKTWK